MGSERVSEHVRVWMGGCLCFRFADGAPSRAPSQSFRVTVMIPMVLNRSLLSRSLTLFSFPLPLSLPRTNRSIEDDFCQWKKELWPALCGFVGKEVPKDVENAILYVPFPYSYSREVSTLANCVCSGQYRVSEED